MKIVIDARLYGLENAGLGRYVMNLIKALELEDQKNRYFVFMRRKYYQRIRFRNKRFQGILADYPHYSFLEQVFLPIQLLKLKPDLVHFPHFNVPLFWWGKQVVTIHDLIKHQSKGIKTTTKEPLIYWFKYLNYRFLVWLAIKRAARVIVPSQYWQGELIKRYHLPKKKVVVTYEGVGDKFLQPERRSNLGERQKLLEKYGLQKPFIIYTGSLYPHKNVERLIQAVKLFNKEKRLILAIACARGSFYKRFKKTVEGMKSDQLINFLGFVPDGDLAGLYQAAEAFIFPTLIEGFGLPGLEAMACDCPVLASDIPVLRETYGKAAFYFNPLDINDMVEKIAAVAGDKRKQGRLIDEGKKQVKKYSWREMARETLEAYENCARL